MDPVSIRIKFCQAGGHVHASMAASEFGPGTSHGRAGTLTFRPAQWEAVRAMLVSGSVLTGHDVVFIDDANLEATLAPVKAARAEGYAEAQSDIHDACLAQRDKVGLDASAGALTPYVEGRMAGLHEAATIAMNLAPVTP